MISIDAMKNEDRDKMYHSLEAGSYFSSGENVSERFRLGAVGQTNTTEK